MNTVKAPKIDDIKMGVYKTWADDRYSQIKAPASMDGSIPYGLNILNIFKTIGNAFIKGKEKRKKIPEVKFKTLISDNFSDDYLYKKLSLNPEEVPLFLEYCEADLNSKNIFDIPNPLKIMEFLMAKNVEFKKLPKK